MLSLIYFIIRVLHPELPSSQVNNYADIIERESAIVGVSPIVMLTIIEHESRFDYLAVSKDGKDIGLMQVRSANYGGKRDWLFNPETNVKAGSYVIKASIDFCRKTLKREPELQEWMSCYTGSCTNEAHYCKATKLTQVFDDYTACMSNALVNRTSLKECRFE